MGTAFLCIVLVILDRFGEAKARQMVLSLVASTREFPKEHVHRVLGATVEDYETREIIQGSETVVRYTVTMASTTPLHWLSQELMGDGSTGLKSVSWAEPSKKGA
jgi:hypothetical protein